MNNRKLISKPGWICLPIVLLLTFLTPVHPVQAFEMGIPIYSLSQQDLDGNGRPDQTTIDCAFATRHDRIDVYDWRGDMQLSAYWRDATDFNNDVWLYDIGADGTIQLIVVYKNEQGHTTAYVYDDRNGDGQVEYRRTGKTIEVLESSYWTARIDSDSNWFLPDGRVNLNIRIRLDGPVPTLDRAPEEYIQDWLKQDGIYDIEFEEAAGDDGIAQYALKRLRADSPQDWGFERSGLQVNEGHFPTGFFERAFFPLLPIPINPKDPTYRDLRYFDFPPNLKVDWLKGQITSVGLDGYPTGHGYHFNDNQYIVKGQVNDVDFESPQAYYDLADNHDPFAEMHIRFFSRPPDDRSMWSLQGMEAVPWQSIRYDWNLFNPGTLRWDYKVGVGGNYNIDSEISFRDFSVRAVPFEQLPYWVTEREWKMTTFVAREGEGYQSSEGIYEWQTDTGDDPQGNPDRAVEAREATHSYMLGVTASPPEEFFQTSYPGFRAERHFNSPSQPYLYFSPVDSKLHLLGAESGIWTIDDKSRIRYANLDGDDYLDQWQYYKNGVLVRQFYTTGAYLLYAGENEVRLRKATVPPSLFQTLPPRDHEEWLSQRQQLEDRQKDLVPGDFLAMLDQFPGQEWRLEGAFLHSFQSEGKGFRFILELEPGFQGYGGPDVDQLQPGVYTVIYQDGFTIETITSSGISAALNPVVPVQMQESTFSVAIHNRGLENLPESMLELWATSPEGDTSIVATQTITVLPQTTITPALLWAPPVAGKWTLTPKIRLPQERLITGETIQVSVVSAQIPVTGVLVPNSTSPKILPFILVVIGIFASIASFVVTKVSKKTLVE